jgi:predicted nucleic acid-binding protein
VTAAFLDTAVLMYAAGADHELREPSQRLVRRVAAGGFEAAISADVVQEILHRFVAIRRPELGAVMARDALDLFDPVLPITHAVMTRMPTLVRRYPALSARDLVHVATCLEAVISRIVSPDRGFDSVAELERVDIHEAAMLSGRG